MTAVVTGYTRWHSFEERYWGRVEKTETCWNWTGRLTYKGYGVPIGWNGLDVSPHRVAYILAHGDIPSGLVVDHLCRNRRCVNPAHLEAVTAKENTDRGTRARWREDCPNGHPAQQFRRTLSSGKNLCVQCRRDSDLRRDAKHRERRRAEARARHARQRGEVSA